MFDDDEIKESRRYKGDDEDRTLNAFNSSLQKKMKVGVAKMYKEQFVKVTSVQIANKEDNQHSAEFDENDMRDFSNTNA